MKHQKLEKHKYKEEWDKWEYLIDNFKIFVFYCLLKLFNLVFNLELQLRFFEI